MKSKEWILAGFFAALTVVGTFIRIPFPLVPLTLHVLIVLSAGFLLGARFGLLSQVIYLLLGLAGLPVFTGGGGIGYVFSPTFGYVLAYPAAAWIVGSLSSGGERTTVRFFMASLAGISIIYLLGASVLYCNLNFLAGKDVGVYQTLKIGVLPFIVPDLLKGGVASLFALKILPLLSGEGGRLSKSDDLPAAKNESGEGVEAGCGEKDGERIQK